MSTRAEEIRTEALGRAVNGRPNQNYAAIYNGFEAKGIPFDEIRPRENVFTFNAWRALGRHVRKGEHGVRVITFLETSRKDKDGDGNEVIKSGRRPWTTTVFHISQTDADEPKES